MKSRSLLPLCLLLSTACGGDGTAAATTTRRRREATARHTENEEAENDLPRRHEVSDVTSDDIPGGDTTLDGPSFHEMDGHGWYCVAGVSSCGT